MDRVISTPGGLHILYVIGGFAIQPIASHLGRLMAIHLIRQKLRSTAGSERLRLTHVNSRLRSSSAQMRQEHNYGRSDNTPAAAWMICLLA